MVLWTCDVVRSDRNLLKFLRKNSLLLQVLVDMILFSAKSVIFYQLVYESVIMRQ